MPWKSKPRMPGWKPYWLEQPILVIEPLPPPPAPEPVVEQLPNVDAGLLPVEPVVLDAPEPVAEPPEPVLEPVVEPAPAPETPVWTEPEAIPEANTVPAEEETF